MARSTRWLLAFFLTGLLLAGLPLAAAHAAPTHHGDRSPRAQFLPHGPARLTRAGQQATNAAQPPARRHNAQAQRLRDGVVARRVHASASARCPRAPPR